MKARCRCRRRKRAKARALGPISYIKRMMNPCKGRITKSWLCDKKPKPAYRKRSIFASIFKRKKKPYTNLT